MTLKKCSMNCKQDVAQMQLIIQCYSLKEPKRSVWTVADVKTAPMLHPVPVPTDNIHPTRCVNRIQTILSKPLPGAANDGLAPSGLGWKYRHESPYLQVPCDMKESLSTLRRAAYISPLGVLRRRLNYRGNAR